jgi:hypothetical protein
VVDGLWLTYGFMVDSRGYDFSSGGSCFMRVRVGCGFEAGWENYVGGRVVLMAGSTKTDIGFSVATSSE